MSDARIANDSIGTPSLYLRAGFEEGPVVSFRPFNVGGRAGKRHAAGAKTQRERDYIGAHATFYKETDKLDHRTRALAYEKAMDQLQVRYPEDHEAAILRSTGNANSES